MIYRFALAQWSVQVNVLLNNCKQNIMSLSLLVGTTVDVILALQKNVDPDHLEKPADQDIHHLPLQTAGYSK